MDHNLTPTAAASTPDEDSTVLNPLGHAKCLAWHRGLRDLVPAQPFPLYTCPKPDLPSSWDPNITPSGRPFFLGLTALVFSKSALLAKSPSHSVLPLGHPTRLAFFTISVTPKTAARTSLQTSRPPNPTTCKTFPLDCLSGTSNSVGQKLCPLGLLTIYIPTAITVVQQIITFIT